MFKRVFIFTMIFCAIFSTFTLSSASAEEIRLDSTLVQNTEESNHNLVNIGGQLWMNRNTEKLYFEEPTITPYSISAIIAKVTAQLILLCVKYCDKIQTWATKTITSAHLPGKLTQAKGIWMSYNNYYISNHSKAPVSTNSSWNNPGLCLWNGDPIGGHYICPMSL